MTCKLIILWALNSQAKIFLCKHKLIFVQEKSEISCYILLWDFLIKLYLILILGDGRVNDASFQPPLAVYLFKALLSLSLRYAKCNAFHATRLFLYPLKTSENIWCSANLWFSGSTERNQWHGMSFHNSGNTTDIKLEPQIQLNKRKKEGLEKVDCDVKTIK